MGFWDGLKRLLFGFKKVETLEEWIDLCKTPWEAVDYAGQHFVWEPDSLPKDEWQEPHRAFKSLQTRETASDCDDFATVFHAYFDAKRIDNWLVYVGWRGAAHAICVFRDGRYLSYTTNNRVCTGYDTMEAVAKSVHRYANVIKYVRWDDKTKRFTYRETEKI